MSENKIVLAIVDDHPIFRNGISSLLREFKELQIVFEAENGRHMQELLATHDQPDIILMDINMPLMDGYEATKWLKSNYPKLRVLALSMYEDDEAVIKMIKCGACGYILKKTKPRELLEAIQTLFEKGVFISELVSGKLMRSVLSEDTDPKISDRELGFLKLCCSELTYKEIASQLFVSPRTVDNYRESLFLKLNLKTRSGLILYAIKKDIYKV